MELMVNLFKEEEQFDMALNKKRAVDRMLFGSCLIDLCTLGKTEASTKGVL